MGKITRLFNEVRLWLGFGTFHRNFSLKDAFRKFFFPLQRWSEIALYVLCCTVCGPYHKLTAEIRGWVGLPGEMSFDDLVCIIRGQSRETGALGDHCFLFWQVEQSEWPQSSPLSGIGKMRSCQRRNWRVLSWEGYRTDGKLEFVEWVSSI